MSRTLPRLKSFKPDNVSSVIIQQSDVVSLSDGEIGAPVCLLDHWFELGFIKTGEFLFALNDDRALEQVRILQHQLNRLILGWRLLLHMIFSVERCPRVQKRLDRIVADDLS